MAVIFEGNDLVVHETDGDSQYAVITFDGADRAFCAVSEFFAEKPIVFNKIKSIGITSKRSEWFISDEADHVISLINDRLQNYSNRIIYGYSMGAYPALTWSRRLKATTVFSMCPKYSLDPNQCNVDQDYVNRWFHEKMTGMKVSADQVSGRIFILYDPEHHHDTYHAELIKNALRDADVTMIKSFFSHHAVPLALRGRYKFRRMINALASGTKAEVCQVYSQERRHSLYNLEALLNRTVFPCPSRAVKVLSAEAVLTKNELKPIFGQHYHMTRLSHRLSEQGRFEEATLFRNIPFLYARYGRSIDKSIIASGSQHRFTDAPLDFHGSLLSYDIENKTFIGQDLLIGTSLRPFVLLRPISGKLYIEVKIGEERFYLYEEEKKILMTDQRRPSNLTLEKSPRNAHHHIRSQHGYLRAHPNGMTDLISTNKLIWEEFAIPSLWPTTGT